VGAALTFRAELMSVGWRSLREKTALVVTAFAVSLASSPALAKETAIDRSQVPGVVLVAVTAKYPGAQLVRFAREVEHGKIAYEVRVELGATRAELILAPDGKIQVEEQTLAMAEVPAAVREGLAKSRFGRAKVLRAERVTKSGNDRRPTYEIVVALDGKSYEVVFTPTGRIVGEERAEQDD
jgi:hypothetical protein